MSEPDLPPLREVIARHDLGARKSLGQHFLFDMNLTRRIARAAILSGAELSQGTVIEVGPGPGGLTRALLLEGAERLVAIERDERCLGALAELGEAFPGRLTVISGDALEVETTPLGPAPRRIVANLPYNVSTQLLIGWLELIAREPGALSALVLMFQKEVALRLTAQPRSKDYGRLSVLTQWLCEVEILFDVSPKAFVPPPKVTSSVARLIPRAAPSHPARAATLQKVTAAAFGQRRKMLRQSLKSLGGDTATLLEAAGVKETARAEELTVADFCRLAEAWDALRA